MKSEKKEKKKKSGGEAENWSDLEENVEWIKWKQE